MIVSRAVEATHLPQIDSTTEPQHAPAHVGDSSTTSSTRTANTTEPSSLKPDSSPKVDKLPVTPLIREIQKAPPDAPPSAQALDEGETSSDSGKSVPSVPENFKVPDVSAAPATSGPSSVGIEDRLEEKEPASDSSESSDELSALLRSHRSWTAIRLLEAQRRRFPIQVPEGHKLVHIVRHCRAWNKYSPALSAANQPSLRLRPDEDRKQLHDPGLTPGGIRDAKRFTALYRNLRSPTLVVTSPLRRCLQTSIHAFSKLIESGEVRVIANPDLQEVTTDLCDTGTPLDVLRKEFPQIQFPDDLFPDVWPRNPTVCPVKDGTIYADTRPAIQARANRFQHWLKNDLDDNEVIVLTHGSFAHFLFNHWHEKTGLSLTTQLENGQARPMTLPGKSLPGNELKTCGTLLHVGPTHYPTDTINEDNHPDVYLRGKRDYGIFTPLALRDQPPNPPEANNGDGAQIIHENP